MTADTADKSTISGLAMFLSFVWPGLGQLYQHRFVTGAMFLVGSLLFTAVALLFKELSNPAWLAVAALALWSVVDVYRSRPPAGTDG
jgi:TM2 domain-containing membrane protein YozV